jgi:hypothetical protein
MYVILELNCYMHLHIVQYLILIYEKMLHRFYTKVFSYI